MARRQVQYTIRHVPPAVDKALRQRARERRRSLNDIAREMLARGLGVEAAEAPHTDLDAFFGSWVADPVVDRALADQRRIDEDLWK